MEDCPHTGMFAERQMAVKKGRTYSIEGGVVDTVHGKCV
jgi:hypothetical protein